MARIWIVIGLLAASVLACGGESDGAGGGLRGVYIDTGSKLGEYDALVFEKGGVVHDNISTLESVDEYRKRKPKRVGTFQIQGTSVTVQFPGVEPKTYPIIENGRSIGEGRHRFNKSDGMTDGWTLDGSWSANRYSGNAGAFTSSQASLLRSFHFAKTGRYGDTSFVSATTRDNPGSPAPRGTAGAFKGGGGLGTYEIKGDRLLLTGADGKTKSVPFYPRVRDSGTAVDKILYIGGTSYLKR